MQGDLFQQTSGMGLRERERVALLKYAYHQWRRAFVGPRYPAHGVKVSLIPTIAPVVGLPNAIPALSVPAPAPDVAPVRRVKRKRNIKPLIDRDDSAIPADHIALMLSESERLEQIADRLLMFGYLRRAATIYNRAASTLYPCQYQERLLLKSMRILNLVQRRANPCE